MTAVDNDEEHGPNHAGDYFLVCAHGEVWYVNTVMARHIETCLDTTPLPRWIRFVDHVGSRIRLRSARVEAVVQSTAAQRAQERGFFRALRQEGRGERSWEDRE